MSLVLLTHKYNSAFILVFPFSWHAVLRALRCQNMRALLRS